MLAPWGPKNDRNGPIRATDGKNRIDGCDATKISLVLPIGIVRIDEKTARYGPFFRRKSVFTHRRIRVGGAGGTKVPFRCNSLRRSTPAGLVHKKIKQERRTRQWIYQDEVICDRNTFSLDSWALGHSRMKPLYQAFSSCSLEKKQRFKVEHVVYVPARRFKL